jgi:hypothetical protein
MLVRRAMPITILALSIGTCVVIASETNEEQLSRTLAKESEARVQVTHSGWTLIRDPRLVSGHLTFTSGDSSSSSSSLPLNDVARIQIKRDSGLKGTLLGAFFVGGMGVMLGASYATLDDTDVDMGQGALIGGTIGALIGAAFGFMIGNELHHWSTVYETNEASH